MDCIARRTASMISIWTFGGNPLACAAADATITALQEDGLIQNAANIGAMLIDGLKKLAETHPIIREVRGMGLMIGN